MSDNGVEPKEERSPFTSTWTIEWKDKASHVVNTQTENDYPQALSLFNELSSSGIDVVLYEIRTPIADPSAQPKKIPILNSAKAKKSPRRTETASRWGVRENYKCKQVCKNFSSKGYEDKNTDLDCCYRSFCHYSFSDFNSV